MNNKVYFNSVADKWDYIRRHLFPDSIRETAVKAAGDLKGKITADVGAGTGYLTELLWDNGAKVIAIDHSEKMIVQLRQKFCCNPHVNIRYGEDKNLPLPDNIVDYVFANMFLHHVEDPQTAINEMVRILKPDGKLIITDLDEHNFEFLVTEQHDKWMGFKREDVVKWFSNAGLSDVSIDCTNANCCSSSNNGNEKAEISTFIAVGKKSGLSNEA
jgi:ubiquinone/menaquinone biosynthesis C-methylase UbiE